MLLYQSVDSVFSDRRLFNRFTVIISQLLHAVGQSIPLCGAVWSQTKAIYRFFDNPVVDAPKLLYAESSRLERCMGERGGRRFYHLQDTTTLNYSDSKGRYDLGCLNYIDHRGLFLHSSLVLDDTKVLLGLLTQDTYSRRESQLGSSRQDHSLSAALPIEVKESYRWVRHFEAFQTLMLAHKDTQGISICDAEGDFYELFAAKHVAHVDLLVRLKHNHNINTDTTGTDKETNKVLTALSRQPSVGFAFTQVTLADKHQTREAHLDIRFKKISLPLPERLKWSSVTPQHATSWRQKDKQTGGLTLWVVQAKEVNPPPKTPAIEWTVLTTLPVADYWEALDVIQTYALRWQIEIFHLALKEGCAIEKLQLQTQHRLKNAITIYSIIAAYVVKMRYLSHYCPQQAMAITGFSVQNYQTLVAFLRVHHRLKSEPVKQPTVEDFTKIIVMLGGGKPKQIGIRALWRGLAKADTIVKAAQINKNE